MKARPARLAATLLASLASVGAVSLVFLQIDSVPAVGFDEWFYLARHDRLVTYGDARDLVGWDLFANNADIPKLPPLLYPLRFAAHAGLGRGAEIARAIGAVEFVLLAILIALLARRRGAPAWAALLGPAVFLTFPTVFFFARTYRSEQDIFFFGTLSILLPGLVSSARWRLAIWAASGFLAGLAASMHPMGALFPLAHVLAALPRLRHGANGAGRSSRLAMAWAVGLALPALATLAYFLSDWSNTRTFLEGARAFYAVHGSYRVGVLAALGAAPGWFPDRLAAAVNAARWGLAPFGASASGIEAVLIRLWGMSVTAALLGSAVVWLRHMLGKDRPAGPLGSSTLRWASAVLAAALLSVLLLPNSDYAIYFNGLAWAATFLAACRLTSRPFPVRLLGAAALIVFAAAGLAWAYRVTTSTHRPVAASAAAQIVAMRTTARSLGIDSGGRERVYADTTSWAGAGPELAPLYEYLILDVAPLRSQYEGLVVSTDWYAAFVPGIANFTGRPIDVDARRQRMEALVGPLSFGASLLVEGNPGRPDVLRLWLVRASGNPRFFFLRRDGRLERYLGRPVCDEQFAHPRGSFTAEQRLSPGQGRYALTLTGPHVADSLLRVRTDGGTLVRGRLDNFPHRAVGALTFFDSAGGVTAVQVDGRAVAKGVARLRCWRLVR